jgi:alpha-tubulin suppressor-like RCC1 family protein
MRRERLLAVLVPFLAAAAVPAAVAPPDPHVTAPASSGATAVATANMFACVVTASGGVQCWGANGSGQLGDGSYVSRGTPGDVAGIGSAVTGVATGYAHACAWTASGAVKCWGQNAEGQLGDGTTTSRATPGDVTGLAAGATAVAAGHAHTCALTAAGGVKCWGQNAYGQLGDGTMSGRSTPADVSGLTSGVVAIAAGEYHTCAVTGGGGLKCWGANSYGALGDGSIDSHTLPVDVVGLASGVAGTSGGHFHTCAVANGAVKCWGRNDRGQLGDGTTTSRTTPVDAIGLSSGMTSVAAGDSHSCATTAGGDVRCWGGNDWGQLGDGTAVQRPTPVAVSGLATAVSRVAAGYDHTCALGADGTVQCWGADVYGQLGAGAHLKLLAPGDVQRLSSGVVQVVAGSSHTCAVTASGSVTCWGSNTDGQLGDDTNLTRSSPVEVPGASTAAIAAGGGSHTCVLTAAGGVKCWGRNNEGQLGDGTTTPRTTPVNVSGLASGAVAVATGLYHTCAITGVGGVKCWGDNSTYQLGDSSGIGRSTPVDVGGLASGVAGVAAGESHTCALTTAGGVKCWGRNHEGQLGDGTMAVSAIPVDVAGLASGVVAIAAGQQHTCALTSGGGVKCWGRNYEGQLGVGTVVNAASPVDVTGLSSGVARLSCGERHTCAVTSGGGVKCWGSNGSAQLGDGTTTNGSTPVDVIGLVSGAAAVAAGGRHTCALTSAGGVKCWGGNDSGQLGDGRTWSNAWPLNVVGYGAAVQLSNLVQVYDGSPKPVAVVTVPGGLSVTVTYTGIGGTTYGPTTSAPAAVGSYSAFAKVTAGGAGSATATLTIATAAPTITGVSPSSGPDYGGTPITISGTSFLPGVTVEINGVPADGTYVDSTTVTAITPSVTGEQVASIVVRNPSPSAGAAEATFAYLAYPQVFGISPSWGPVGTTVVIAGRNFSAADASVSFGGQAAVIGGRSATQVLAVVPSGLAAGPVNVTVTNPSQGRSHTYPRLFTVAAQQPGGSQAVAAGHGFTCAVTATGRVQCWGSNDSGQLGDGTQASRGTAADVVNVSSGATAVAAGSSHACMLTSAGGVKCWGANDKGQLGDGSTLDRSTPVDVVGLGAGVSGIVAGAFHTCALTAAGGAKCWGGNDAGAIGDGTTTARLTPVDVIGLSSGVAAIAAGWNSTCALTTAGGAKCWGANTYGQIGDGTTTDRGAPADVAGLITGVAGVTAGDGHACAVTASGALKCWGLNDSGQVGDGTTTQRATPVDVAGFASGAARVSAGASFTCAVTTDGGVKCWGRNAAGQLGDGTTTQRSTPAAVLGLAHLVSRVAAGYDHACALATDGGVQCWGADATGQLGVGTNPYLLVPADVPRLSTGASAVRAGYSHACAITTAGGVRCWGSNGAGELGDGTLVTRGTPAAVSGLAAGVSSIAVGSRHSCALTLGGGVRCWGNNDYGQLGDGTTMSRSTPVDVSGLTSGVTAIAAGIAHTCALTSAGGLTCWGRNSSGQLGDGTTTTRRTPVDVNGLSSGVAAVAAGGAHTCALGTTGGLKCWGDNSSGQLGDGTWSARATAADVSGLTSGVSSVSAGELHTCAVTAGGGVKCWGDNYNGQLGDASVAWSVTPIDVIGLTSGVAAVSAGYVHTCAVTSAGGVKCWGTNSRGQVGDNSTTARSAPTDVTGLAGGIAGVSAGGEFTCALTTGGGVKCWGDDAYGQLGDGRVFFRPVATTALGYGVNISFSNLDQIYDGSAKPVIVTTTPAGLTAAITYTGTGTTAYGPSQSAPAEAGTYTVLAVVDAPSISGSSSATLTIYNPATTITSVTPASGPDYGGTAITISGTGFRPGATVLFNGQASGGVFVNATTITATTPSAAAEGIANVVVRNGGPSIESNGAGSFTYLAYPRVTSISPAYGAVGASVTITGISFSSDAAVSFGTQSAVVASRSATQLVVSVPPGLAPGLVDVTVLNVALARGRTYPRAFTVGAARSTGAGAVAAGRHFTCAVIGGGVRCWGANGSGQLGDGTVISRGTPADVAGLQAGMAAVAAGASHACALATSGGVTCWGDNYFGQLGDGSTTSRNQPSEVTGLGSNMTALAAGANHTCALGAGGGVRCWGANGSGQLGDGTAINRPTPVDVVGLTSGVLAIAAGNSHTCALTTGGAVRCWGANVDGQLGDGTTIDHGVPTAVSGASSGFFDLAAGASHSCAVTATGGVQCWGANRYGQLGDGTTNNATVPVSVSGLTSGIVAVSAGSSHGCALTSGGGVQCWGRNESGELGDGTSVDRATPGQVLTLTSGASVLAHGSMALHSCVMTTQGGVKCWGSNGYAELGDGSMIVRKTPAGVSGLTTGATAIAGGLYVECAVTAIGSVKCWGNNAYGQLGDTAPATGSSVPMDVAGLASGVSAVAPGSYHACALVAGRVKCWGDNSAGQLGDGTTTNRTTPVDAGVTAVSVAAGLYHSCAVTSGGAVKCWGDNARGQLGDATSTARLTPADVFGLGAGAAAVAAGYSHTCAVTTAGGVKCWGDNSYGQLGDGTTTSRSTPVTVPGLSGVVTLVAGSSHTCAVTNAGAVECWGRNLEGQVGDGTTTNRTTPAQVAGLGSGVVTVTAGVYHTCAQTGGVKCWGSNADGELGDGTTTDSTLPVDVSGLASGVARIGAGGHHTCALVGGAVTCWGLDADGQAGSGRLLWSGIPIDVIGAGNDPATVTLSGLSQVYNGTARAATVTTTPAGLAVDVTYVGVSGTNYGPTATAPVNAGAYAVIAAVVQAAHQGTATGTLVVTTAPATVFLRNLTQLYDGTPKPVTAETSPAGLAVTFLYTGKGATAYGPSATAPTNVGTYAVTATVSATNYEGTASGTLTVAVGVTLAFTDDPLLARATMVKAVHIAELRQRIAQLRTAHNLAAATWTDATLVPGVTLVKAQHLSELRTALADVYAAAGRTPPTYSTPAIVGGVTVITVAQISELRAAVVAIW